MLIPRLQASPPAFGGSAAAVGAAVPRVTRARCRAGHPRVPSLRVFRRNRGWTLVEMVIVAALVAILAAVALPGYRTTLQRGRRAEAYAALAALQQAQERWRGNHGSYGNLNPIPDDGTLPHIPTRTAGGYYAIDVASATAGGYVATATALGTQADDAGCTVLAVRSSDGNLGYGAGGPEIDWSDPRRCWVR